jgi:hypothetical protein
VLPLPVPAQPDPSDRRYDLLAKFRAVGLADREVREILAAAAEEAERTIPKLIERGTTGSALTAAQRGIVLREIRALMAALWGDVGSVVREGIQRAAEYAAAGEDVLYDYLRSRGLDVEDLRRGFVQRAQNGIEALLAKAANGIPLSTRVYRSQALANKWVDRKVQAGLLLGKSARDIAKDVRDLIRPDVAGGVAYAAQRLARTEINNAYKTAQEARYADEPWSRGMQWHLSRSHPRRDVCDVYAAQDLHGLGAGVYPFQELPNAHPNDMCYQTPVQVDEDEFVDRFLAGEYDDYLDEELGVDAEEDLRAPSIQEAPSSMYEARINRALSGEQALDSVRVGLPRRGSLDRLLRTALRAYESTGFVIINGFLRRGGVVQDNFDRRTKLDVDRIDQAMDKSVLGQDIQVWRGLTRAEKLFGDRLAGNLEGYEWQELAYGSTSTDEAVADQFMVPVPGSEMVKMRVLVHGGIKANVISLGGLGQSEVMLQRGTRWRVIKDRGRHPTKGYRLLDVEVML